MSAILNPESRRFETSARHYLNGRPAYAVGLIQQVSQRAGLTQKHAVLDLGCGPGQLAVAFAPLAGRSVGIDPEPEMLREATEHAGNAGVEVEFIRSSSDELGPALGRFRLVTIGRAFHWMDRAATLAALDQIIEPDGAVVLFDHRHPKLPQNAAANAFAAILATYSAGYEPRALRAAPDWVPNEAVLLDAAFSSLERISVIEKRSIPFDHLINRAFSFSATSPARLGAKADQLSGELKQGLRDFLKDGRIEEVVESTALIARRS